MVMQYSEQGGAIDADSELTDLLLDPSSVPGFWYESDFRHWYAELLNTSVPMAKSAD